MSMLDELNEQVYIRIQLATDKQIVEIFDTDEYAYSMDLRKYEMVQLIKELQALTDKMKT